HRDTVLHTIPLFHVNGWGTPHWVTCLGGRHVLIDRFEADEVLRLIEVERVTRLHLVPTMATALLTSPSLGRRDRSPSVGVTVGEVCVRSNHVMAGDWNRPAETAETLRGGRLRTGDLATVDPEGYVTIVDRKKDIIVSGGENVSSVQVEQALCAHPAVVEAAV